MNYSRENVSQITKNSSADQGNTGTPNNRGQHKCNSYLYRTDWNYPIMHPTMLDTYYQFILPTGYNVLFHEKKLFFKSKFGDFPGGPAVNTSPSKAGGAGFNLWSGS